MDEQVATALLTGIIAETDRFSNSKTSSETMSISSKLLAAGANQQLVATKLQEGVVAELHSSTNDAQGDKLHDVDSPPKPDDGTLEIAHESSEAAPSTEADKPAESIAAFDIEGNTVLPPKEEHEPPQISQNHTQGSITSVCTRNVTQRCGG